MMYNGISVNEGDLLAFLTVRDISKNCQNIKEF